MQERTTTTSGVETATEKWRGGVVLTDHSNNFDKSDYYYEIVKYIIYIKKL